MSYTRHCSFEIKVQGSPYHNFSLLPISESESRGKQFEVRSTAAVTVILEASDGCKSQPTLKNLLEDSEDLVIRFHTGVYRLTPIN